MGKSEVFMPLMTFGKIDNGQYDVEVKLNNAGINITPDIVRQLNQGATNAVVTFQNNLLKYKSETLLPPPENIGNNKKKVLFILGNPATHSIVNKMFYYSQKNEKKRHGFWKKLYNAGLLDSELEIRKITEQNCNSDKSKILEIEACKRRKYILSGNTNKQFVLGLTTFYSLPSSVGKNVKAVEDLFKLTTDNEKLLNQIRGEELKRIQSYGFATNAIWVFTQCSSYEFVRENIEGKCSKNLLYWTMFKWGKESSGEHLKELLMKRIAKKT